VTYVVHWPVLREGYEGHPAPTVRWLLRAQAFEVEELAGFSELDPEPDRYDFDVETGVMALQRAVGLEQDGILGRRTWPYLCLTVRRGSTGDAVRGDQYENQYRNMADPAEARGLMLDGIFGPLTERWVKGFQGVCELRPDGIVGPKTWSALVVGMYAG
jgi:peptidoglycan hydrolase-like protein with peptidoglycan-binding domain